MAYSTPTLDLLIANRAEIPIQITSYKWAEFWGLELYDFEVKITMGGIDSVGRGISPNQSVAMEKSVSEALERNVKKALGLDASYSSAVHWDLEKAKENAIIEACERDSFLYNFIAKNSFYDLVTDNYNDLLPKKPTELGIETTITLKSLPYSNIFGACVFAKGLRYEDPFGLVVGLGGSADPFMAVEKAMYECLSKLTFAITQKVSLLVQSGTNKTPAEFRCGYDHFLHALSPTYKPASFFSFFETESCGADLVAELKPDEGEFVVTDLNRVYPQFPDFHKIHFAGYKHQSLQNLFFGATSGDNLNSKRFNQKEGSKWHYEKLAHPLG